MVVNVFIHVRTAQTKMLQNCTSEPTSQDGEMVSTLYTRWALDPLPSSGILRGRYYPTQFDPLVEELPSVLRDWDRVLLTAAPLPKSEFSFPVFPGPPRTSGLLP